MEYIELLYVTLTIVFVSVAYQIYRSKSTQRNLPPSPFPCLPFLGHLHLLKPRAHRTLHELSRKHGPVFFFKFGSHLAVIVSSSSAAEECFTKNDVVLANRPIGNSMLARHLDYINTAVTTAPYGDHWRNLCRICATDIFSPLRLGVFLSTRQDEVVRLLRKLEWQWTRARLEHGLVRVQLKPLLTDLTFNVIMRMVAGKRYYGDDEVINKEEAREFKGIIDDIFHYSGLGNKVEFLPLLKWIVGVKFEKKVKALAERTDKFLLGLIDEHRKNKEEAATTTMIDHLLALQETQPEYYNNTIIKGLVLIMLLAGTDTSAVTLEWAMTNLVNHPEVLEKAKKELDDQIEEERLINELDLPKLRYLQNIISETFRLYPASPLLLPHYSSDDCTIGGYRVPRNTMVIINAWAIHRDPAVWDDPETFRPERFEDEAIREGYKLLPFGHGRRACPGAGLAQRIVGLTLGSMIQCFEWKGTGFGPGSQIQHGAGEFLLRDTRGLFCKNAKIRRCKIKKFTTIES